MNELSKIIGIKKYLDRSLYNGHSLITYTLLVEIIESSLKNKPITIKSACTQSKSSVMSVRKHLNFLIRDGWVSFARDKQDRRQQLLFPTYKLKKLTNELEKRLIN